MTSGYGPAPGRVAFAKLVWPCLPLMFSACLEPTGEPSLDAGRIADSGVVIDAGGNPSLRRPDAGTTDLPDDAGGQGADAPRDAGMPDGSHADGGTDGVRDAGMGDGGVRDAGAPDGSHADGGADGVRDAGMVDGGVRDAGEPEDAGVVRDAGGEEDAGGGVTDGGNLDAGGADAGGGDGGDGGDGGAASGIWETCFPGLFDPQHPGPAYDALSPIVGAHCSGTNHQVIEDVERVVFLGDSITVGTPPWGLNQLYRGNLADQLAARFGLEAPSSLWKGYNLSTGTSGQVSSGAFSSCAEWGGRTADLLSSSGQLERCFAPETQNQKTLVIITMGGNDLASLVEAGATGPIEEIWVQAAAFVYRMQDAVAWLQEDGRFTRGVDIVFANVYEYTDDTADVESCDGAGSYGLSSWNEPSDLRDIMRWINEEYMRIAVESGTDMIFLYEHFCGHGFRAEDPNSPCYRGPNTPTWFDFTCIHPTADGHAQIAQRFLDVITE